MRPSNGLWACLAILDTAHARMCGCGRRSIQRCEDRRSSKFVDTLTGKLQLFLSFSIDLLASSSTCQELRSFVAQSIYLQLSGRILVKCVD